MGSNFIMLGFAVMNCFHTERMPKHKGALFLTTEVCQPLPGEHALDRHSHLLARRRNPAQKNLGRRGEILVEQLRALLIEDTDVHGLGM
jgi:hypothetical protein